LGTPATESKTRKKTKLKKPRKYTVIILNDDYTAWQFVVMTLVKIFNKSEDEANTITKNVHNGGEGVCGVYTKEIAESKVQAATEFATINKQPLRTVMKPV
jgi:ATP-dependent Clp protease adaptor protein ClpS